MEIVERDDGFITAQRPGRYFARSADWREFERTALDLSQGTVLDVGCGAGRFALELQDLGATVTGLDLSPGAVAVSRQRGVRDVAEGTVRSLAAGPVRYDTFLLMGENLGLLEGAGPAAGFLGALAAIAAPGARIIGHGADPYPAKDTALSAYLERRPAYPDQLPGELRIRVRYRDVATPWFGYLLCSPAELASLAEPSGWQVLSAEYADRVNYLAVLECQRHV